MSDKPVRQHGAMEFSEAPVDLNNVRQYRLDRVRKLSHYPLEEVLMASSRSHHD